MTDSLAELPDNILIEVFHQLYHQGDIKGYRNLATTCKKLQRIGFGTCSHIWESFMSNQDCWTFERKILSGCVKSVASSLLALKDNTVIRNISFWHMNREDVETLIESLDSLKARGITFGKIHKLWLYQCELFHDELLLLLSKMPKVTTLGLSFNKLSKRRRELPPWHDSNRLRRIKQVKLISNNLNDELLLLFAQNTYVDDLRLHGTKITFQGDSSIAREYGTPEPNLVQIIEAPSTKLLSSFMLDYVFRAGICKKIFCDQRDWRRLSDMVWQKHRYRGIEVFMHQDQMKCRVCQLESATETTGQTSDEQQQQQ